jgi:lysophospholipase L1-like esterase
MADRLEALLDKSVDAAPDGLIVLATLTPLSWNPAAFSDYHAKIPGIVQARAAKAQHIVSVDMSRMPLSDLASDSVHPNDQGYAYMADVWYAAIQDLLPK